MRIEVADVARAMVPQEGIEPRKRADLVAVAGDPLDFGDLADRIERVWQDGRLVVGGTTGPALPVPSANAPTQRPAPLAAG